MQVMVEEIQHSDISNKERIGTTYSFQEFWDMTEKQPNNPWVEEEVENLSDEIIAGNFLNIENEMDI